MDSIPLSIFFTVSTILSILRMAKCKDMAEGRIPFVQQAHVVAWEILGKLICSPRTLPGLMNNFPPLCRRGHQHPKAPPAYSGTFLSLEACVYGSSWAFTLWTPKLPVPDCLCPTWFSKSCFLLAQQQQAHSNWGTPPNVPAIQGAELHLCQEVWTPASGQDPFKYALPYRVTLYLMAMPLSELTCPFPEFNCSLC